MSGRVGFALLCCVKLFVTVGLHAFVSSGFDQDWRRAESEGFVHNSASC